MRRIADAADEEGATEGDARVVAAGMVGPEAEVRTSLVAAMQMLREHGGTTRRCRKLQGGRDDPSVVDPRIAYYLHLYIAFQASCLPGSSIKLSTLVSCFATPVSNTILQVNFQV